jgi:tetratricopeptide (TPR) repeat protein
MAPTNSQQKSSALVGVLNKLVSQIARVKTPLQLSAFAVIAAVMLLIFIAGRANVASILSTGSIAVCIIVFAQLVPLCSQITDEGLKVKLIIGLFVLFLLAFIVLVTVALKSVSIATADVDNRARSYLSAGKCADGYAAAIDLSKNYPNWAEAYSYKGWAEFCMEKYTDAVQSFRTAIMLDNSATGGQQLHRYEFNLAAALMKEDVVDFKLRKTIAHSEETIDLLKKVELHYFGEEVDDLDTSVNLALAYLMNVDCEKAKEYAHKIETKREEPDLVRAIAGVCAVIQGNVEFDIAKQNAGDLRWIFSSDTPPERRYDFLIPAQIGYLRFSRRSSEFPMIWLAQRCCKAP